MKKVWYLSTCDTSRRIIRELGLKEHGFELQDIKKEPLTGEQVDFLKQLAGSYEALFSRLSRKYRAMGLKDKPLGEDDYRTLLLSDYTFLKRPVVVVGNRIFVGSGKPNLAALAAALGQSG